VRAGLIGREPFGSCQGGFEGRIPGGLSNEIAAELIVSKRTYFCLSLFNGGALSQKLLVQSENLG